MSRRCPTVIGHNLRFDPSALTRTVERLSVSMQDATMALDAFNKAYPSARGLKDMVAAMLSRRPTVGEVVEIRQLSLARPRRLARVLSTSDGAGMRASVRVIFLDTHEEDTIGAWEAYELDDPISALAWLAELGE